MPRRYWWRLSAVIGLSLGVLAYGFLTPYDPAHMGLLLLLTLVIGGAFALEDRWRSSALREREQLYRALFVELPNAVALSRGRHFVECNERFAALFGLTRDRIIGRTNAVLTPELQPDGRRTTEITAPYAAAALAGTPQTFVLQHQRGDGVLFDAEVSLRRVPLNGLPHLLGTVRDLSAHNRAYEAQARQQEAVRRLSAELTGELNLDALLALIVQRATQVMEGGQATIHLFDPATRTLRVARQSPHAPFTLPRDPEPLDAPGLAGLVARTQQGHRVDDYQHWPLARPDLLGPARPTCVMAEPLLAHGALLGVLVVSNERIGRPFTDEDHAALQLFAPYATLAIANAQLVTVAHRELAEKTAAEAALRATMTQLEQTFQTNPASLIILRIPDRVVLDVNRTWEQLSGYAAAEVKGQPATAHPTWVDAEERLRFIAEVEAMGRVRSRQVRLRTKAGQPWTGLASAERMTLDGIEVLLVATLDITDQQRAEERAARERQRLEALDQITAELNRELNVSRIFSLITQRTAALIGAPAAVLWLPDAAGLHLSPAAIYGPATYEETAILRLGEDVPGEAAARRTGVARRQPREGAPPVAIMAEPLLALDQLLGVLAVCRQDARDPFTSQDQATLRLLANQAGIAIKNAEHVQAAQHQLAERNAALAALAAQERSAETVLNSLPAQVAVLGADGTIQAINAAWRTAALTSGDGSLVLTGAGANYLALLETAADVDDPRAGGLAQGIQAVLDGTQPQFSQEYQEPTLHGERWFLLQVSPLSAGHGAVVCRTEITAQKQAEARVTGLLRTAQTLLAGGDLQQTLDTIVAEARTLAHCEHITLLLVDWEAGVLRVAARQGFSEYPLTELPLDRGFSAIVVQTGDPLFITEVQHDPRNERASFDREHNFSTYLGLPIRTQGQVTGVLTFNTQDAREYSARDRALFEAFANQAGLALERAQWHDALAQQAARRGALHQLGQQLTAAPDADAVAHAVIEATTLILPDAIVQVWDQPDPGKELELRGTSSSVPVPFRRQLAPREGLVGAALTSGQPQTSARVSADPRWANRSWAQAVGLESALALPLQAAGRPRGALMVATRTPHAFTADEQQLLQVVANHAAIAFEKAHLFRMEQQRHQQLSALHTINEEITRELNLTTVLQTILGRARELLKAGGGTLALWSEADQCLKNVVWHLMPDSIGDIQFRKGEGMIGTVAHTRRGLLVTDYRTSPHAHATILQLTDTTCAIAEPLLYRDALVGVILLNNHQAPERAFTPDDQQVLARFAAQAAIAIQNARFYSASQRDLQEREQALAAVRTQADFIQTVLASLTAHVAVLDRAGVILHTNAAWQAFATRHGNPDGLRAAEGENYLGALRNQPAIRAALRAVLDGTPHAELEYAYPTADGDPSWFLLQVNGLAGTHPGAVVSHTDITARKRAEDQRTRFLLQLESMQAIGAEIAQEHQLPPLLDLVLAHTQKTVGAASATLLLWDAAESCLVPAANRGYGEAWYMDLRLHLGEGVAGTVAQTRRAVIVNDFQASPYRLDRLQDQFEETRQVRRSLGVPLLCRDELVGVIIARDKTNGQPFEAADQAFLGMLADQAAVAISKAQLYEAATRRQEELEALLGATRAVMSGLALPAILEQIAAGAARISGAPIVKFLLATVDDELTVAATVGRHEWPQPFRVGKGLSGTVAATGEVLYCADCTTDPRNPYQEDNRRLGYRTYLGIPVRTHARVLGVLTFNTLTPRIYRPAELAVLGSFADQAAIAIAHAQAFDATQRALADRSQAAETLARYNLLADQARDVILFLDADLRIVSANRAATETYGYTAAELRTRSIRDLRAPGTSDLLETDASLEAGALFRRTHCRRDGRTFPVEISSRRALVGDAPMQLSIIRDITERVKIEQNLARKAEQLSNLRLVTLEVIRELDLSRVIRLIVEKAATLMAAGSGAVWLWDAAAETLRIHTWTAHGDWMAGRQLRLGEGLAGQIAAQRTPLIDNAYRHSVYAHPETLAHCDVSATLGAPLLYHGNLLGVLVVDNLGTDQQFTPADAELLELFAVQATIAIAHAQELARATRRTDQLRTLHDLTRRLTTLQTPAAVADAVGAAATTLHPTASFHLRLWNAASQHLETVMAQHRKAPERLRAIPSAYGVHGEAFTTQQPVVLADLASASSVQALSPYDRATLLDQEGFRAAAVFPLLFEGAGIGTFSLTWRVPEPLQPEDIDLLQAFAAQAAIAIRNAQLYAAAEASIAQQEAAEAELRKIAQAVEQSPSIVVITDIQGQIEYANPKFTEVTGYTLDEARGQNPRLLKSDQTDPAVYQALWTTILAGQTWHGEFCNRRKDGRLYWEAASISPVHGTDGTITHFIALKQDITAQRQAALDLQINKQHLEHLQTLGTEINQILNVDELLRRVQQEATAMLRAPLGVLYLVDGEQERLVPHSWTGHGEWVRQHTQPLGEGVLGLVTACGEGRIVNNYPESPYAVPTVLQETATTAVMAEPLRHQDSVLGVILLSDTDPARTFTAQDQRFLRLFASQAAIALINARHYEAETARRKEQETLRELAADLTRDIELPEALARLYTKALAFLQGDAGAIYTWDESHGHLVPISWVGFGDWMDTLRLKPGEGVAGEVARTRQGLIVNDFRTSRLAFPPFMAHSPHVAVLGEPLVARGTFLGVLTIARHDPNHPFTTADQARVKLFADQAAIAIEKARLFQAVQVRTLQLEGLHRVASDLTAELHFDRVLQRITDSAIGLIGGERCGLHLYDSTTESLVVHASTGFDFRAEPLRQLPLGTGVSGRVAQTRCSLRVNDYQHSEWTIPFFTALGLQAIMGTPLLYRGELLGVLSLSTTNPQTVFSEADQQLLELLATQAAVALYNARLFTERTQTQESLLQRTKQLETIRTITEQLTRELDPQHVVRTILERMSDLVPADMIILRSWDPVGRRFIPIDSIGVPEAMGKGLVVLEGEGVVGRVAQTGHGEYINDFKESPYYSPRLQKFSPHNRVMAEPLLYQEKLIGTINLNRNPGMPAFTDADLEILRLFAAQAAIALTNARLYADVRAQERRLVAIQRASQAIVGGLQVETTLEQIVDAAVAISGIPNVKLMLLTADRQHLTVAVRHGTSAPPNYTLPVGTGLSGLVAATGDPLQVADCAADPRNVDAAADQILGIRGYLGIPVKAQDRVLGVLSFSTTEAGQYTPEEVAAYTLFAEHAAIALTNAALFRQEEKTARHLEALRAVTQDITSELDLGRLLQLLITKAIDLLHGLSGVVYLWNEAAARLQPQAWVGHPEGFAHVQLRLGEGVAGEVARTRQGLIVPDFRASQFTTPQTLALTSHYAVLAQPLIYRERLVGTIAITRGVTDPPFDAEDLRTLASFAAQAVIAIEHAHLFSGLRESLEALERSQLQILHAAKLRALGEMSAGVAHDLNNVLAAILGETEVLLDTAPPTTRTPLERLRTAARDGAAIVRRLQSFSRREPTGDHEALDLAHLIQDTLAFTRSTWQDRPRRRGVEIAVHTTLPPLPFILGNAAEIREVLTNLINNAVDAMPDGGTLSLTTQLAAPGDDPHPPAFLELDLQDTGRGMDAETQHRIFDPFFTTKGPDGLGMGLAVSFGIMERHGGSITAHSTPGQGTTMRLRFPLAPTATDPSGPPASGETAPESPLRLLMVDDDTRVLDAWADRLRQRGHTVITAADPALVVPLLRAEPPVDAVLTDLSMPGIQGGALAQMIRAEWPALVIGLMTGWADEPGVQTLLRDGIVDALVQKPLDLQHVIATLAACVRRRARPQDPPNTSEP